MENKENVISKFNKGNVEAFEKIFHQLYKRLCSFSLKYVKQNEVAEEIVGDSFLTLWNKRGRFEDLNHLKSYLYITVRNASLDHWKKAGDTVSIENEMIDPTKNMELHIIEEEVHSMLYHALNSLPNKCRKVFEMSCLDKVKYQDIADEMQISLNTVKSQRSRAIQLLRDYFDGQPFYLFVLSQIILQA